MAIWVELFLFFFSYFGVNVSNGIDMITQVHPIKDPESIISANKTYELGFFSPLNTTNRYVGIWFGDIPVKTVVWVANRDRPLNDSSGMLAISEDGNLVLLNGKHQILWSTSVSNVLRNSTAQLLDSGNLVLFDNLSISTLWQSFQFPTDSLLENMELTSDANTNEITLIRSWKSSLNPTIGSFSAGLSPLTFPELTVWNGYRPFWRSGPWNGWFFNGVRMNVTYNSGFRLTYRENSSTNSVYLDGSNLVNKQKGQYGLTFISERDTILAYHALSHEGSLSAKKWNRETTEWETSWSFPENECDIYGRCGPFGSCNSKDSRICSCLSGYGPKHVDEWDSGNFTSGCVRRVPLQCDNDAFIKMTTMKLPESPEWSSELEEECENKCFKDCMCLAYSYYDGVGCISWSGSLIDIQKFSTSGANLYVRVPSSELGHNYKNIGAVIGISIAVGTTVVALCGFLYWLMIAKRRGSKTRKAIRMLKSHLPSQKSLTAIKLEGNLKHIKFEELPFFKFDTLSMATDNFFLRNKLGQGGFGAVYKGKLNDGKEIAVKRLSRSSNQGLEEFTNEVVVISKLQHRNLVRLLGCCIEGDEKMLVYEYMPNKSLDAFLFDPQSHELLDWSKRLNIIEGISRGLLYLHRDSRLRIIHRDLKASNILLDDELNPKISDFGMARIFGGTQNQANTQRVVGTYGYMAPEYAMNGEFSEKSDVFSFGVLLLEIVSGRRNTSFYDDDKYLSLLQYAWKMWNEDNALEIIDSRKAYCEEFEMEILRCIHIGLLCVQEFAVDRPTISNVLSMLSNEGLSLTKPNQPAFTQRYALAQQIEIRCSLNGCSITSIEGR